MDLFLSESSFVPLMSPQATWRLEPQHVLLDAQLHHRRHAIDTIASVLARHEGRDEAVVNRALWRREQSGSTALGCGVAVPHARVDGLARPITLFMRSRWAIDFDAPDGKPVSSFYAILVPVHGDVDDHLRLLSLVAESFLDRDLRSALGRAVNEDEVRTAFAERAALAR